MSISQDASPEYGDEEMQRVTRHVVQATAHLPDDLTALENELQQLQVEKQQRKDRPSRRDLENMKELADDGQSFAKVSTIANEEHAKVVILTGEKEALRKQVRELEERNASLEAAHSAPTIQESGPSRADLQAEILELQEQIAKLHRKKTYYRFQSDDLTKEVGEYHEEIKRLTKRLRDRGDELHDGKNWSKEDSLFDVEQLKRFASEK